MGSAASVSQVYSDSFHWFKQYFDAESYVDDFNSMDKDHDGGVEYEELQNWLRKKATKDDSSWKMVSTNAQIFKIAHTHASASLHRYDVAAEVAATAAATAAEEGGSSSSSSSTADAVVARAEAAVAEAAADTPPDRVVDVDEFRAFLVHLFALSILWVHFKSADQWVEGEDVGNETLTLDEFRLACRTFNTAQSSSASLSNDQIEADFNMLDTNKNGNVDFMEVCDYVCKFIDPSFAVAASNSSGSGTPNTRNSIDLGWLEGETPSERTARRKTRMSQPQRRSNAATAAAGGSSGSSDDGDHIGEDKRDAMDVVAREVDKNKTIAEFEQIKHSTEMALGVL